MKELLGQPLEQQAGYQSVQVALVGQDHLWLR